MEESNVTTVTCEWVDCHEDMYREFAPESVVVACQKDAVAYVTCTDSGQYGPEVSDWGVCWEHATVLVESTIEEGGACEIRTLTDDDRRDYLAGAELGRTVEVTGDQLFGASHVGLAEVGLTTPEGSSLLFDLGWTNALWQRATEWSDQEAW